MFESQKPPLYILLLEISLAVLFVVIMGGCSKNLLSTKAFFDSIETSSTVDQTTTVEALSGLFEETETIQTEISDSVLESEPDASLLAQEEVGVGEMGTTETATSTEETVVGNSAETTESPAGGITGLISNIPSTSATH